MSKYLGAREAVYLRLPVKLVETLHKEAAKSGVSVNSLVTDLLEQRFGRDWLRLKKDQRRSEREARP